MKIIIKTGCLHMVILSALIAGAVFIAIPSFAENGQKASGEFDRRGVGYGVDWQKSGNTLKAVLKGHEKDMTPEALGSIQDEPIPCITEISFSAPEFNKIKGGRDRILMKAAGTGKPLSYWSGIPGTPRIPVWPVRLLPPKGREIIGVRVVTSDMIPVEGIYRIERVQQPLPTSGDESIRPIPPGPEVYGSDLPFPSYQAGNVMVQKKSGYDIFFINLYPVRYNPVSGRVSYCEKMRVELITQALPERFEPNPKAFGEILSLVDNRDDEKITDTYWE